MEQEHLNIGEYAFDPGADNLKDAMQKVESNFNQLFDVAQNLNDQVSPPVILKVTRTLPCRPDKGGLYLIDRKEKGNYTQYIERYNLNFGRVNKKNRPIGDDDLAISGTENVDYDFADHKLNVINSQIFVTTGIITIQPDIPFTILLTGPANETIRVYITEADDTGNWYFENESVSVQNTLWYKYTNTYTLPNNVSQFRLYILFDGYASISTFKIRQEFSLPENRAGHGTRYVLAKWTGTEYVFPFVPDGSEIPVKGKSKFFKNGKLITPAVYFPELTKAFLRFENSSFSKIHLVFADKLTTDYGVAFSRNTKRRINKNMMTDPGEPIKQKGWMRYNNTDFETTQWVWRYSYLRKPFLLNSNDFFRPDLATDSYKYDTLEFSVSEFINAFFVPYNVYCPPSIIPLNPLFKKRIKPLLKFSDGFYHYDIGFQLYKTVNGKKVFGPLNKIRLRVKYDQIQKCYVYK